MYFDAQIKHNSELNEQLKSNLVECCNELEKIEKND